MRGSISFIQYPVYAVNTGGRNILFSRISALYSGEGNAFHNIFLSDAVYDDDGDNRTHRTCHNSAVICRELLLEGRKAQLDGFQPVAVQVNHGAHVVVPYTVEGEDGKGRQTVLRQGKDNPAVNAEGGAAVNLGRFMKAVRYAQHVLAQKEYAEGAECLQYNEGKVGIVHAERLNHDELGDHDGMPGNHHGCQVSHKYFISSRKLQLGKCKGRKGAGEQLEQGDDNRQLQGVQEILQEGYALPYFFIIQCPEHFRNPLYGIGENLRIQLKGSADHPHKGD